MITTCALVQLYNGRNREAKAVRTELISATLTRGSAVPAYNLSDDRLIAILLFGISGADVPSFSGSERWWPRCPWRA